MHIVTDASYVDGYKLRIRFDEGEIKEVDLGPHLIGPFFEPLKDPAYFRQFRVHPDIDTVVWPNRADFSPDFLYDIGTQIVHATKSS